MLSPSERSTDSYSVGDPEDDFEDDDDDWPYYVGDRPDPLQLPTQCNTYFDPTVDLQQSMEALQVSNQSNPVLHTLHLFTREYSFSSSVVNCWKGYSVKITVDFERKVG